MDNIATQLIGRSPLDVCGAGLAALANQLIEEGQIHITGNQIVPGKSILQPPLQVACCVDEKTVNALAQYLSQE